MQKLHAVSGMRLFLIRHGETVDNVRQLYAGSRDSELTSHGVQQATRLGQYLASNGVSLTHIFCSPLRRTRRTAEGLSSALDAVLRRKLAVTYVPALVEQDFGSLEGVSWATPARVPHGVPIIPVESKELVAARCDTFLDQHLLPLVRTEQTSPGNTVAVVSHGITLSILWQRLMRNFRPGSVGFSARLGADLQYELGYLGGWSNTGYLELTVLRLPSTTRTTSSYIHGVPLQAAANRARSLSANAYGPATNQATEGATAPLRSDAAGPRSNRDTDALKASPTGGQLVEWTCEIQAVNSTEHLNTLKRTRGGIGSAEYDESQKSMDTFFKKKSST